MDFSRFAATRPDMEVFAESPPRSEDILACLGTVCRPMGADFGDIVGAGLVQFGLPYCMYRRGRRVNERKFRATENAVLNSLLSPFYAPFVEKYV